MGLEWAVSYLILREYFFFLSISVTGPLSEQQIAYVSRETLQVVSSQVLVVDIYIKSIKN